MINIIKDFKKYSPKNLDLLHIITKFAIWFHQGKKETKKNQVEKISENFNILTVILLVVGISATIILARIAFPIFKK